MMTEADYMDATNLAKIRIAEHCLRDTCFPENQQGFGMTVESILGRLMGIRHRLEQRAQQE